MSIRSLLLSLCCLALAIPPAGSQTGRETDLQQAIRRATDTCHARIGIGIEGLDFPFRLVINGNAAYPMQSVYKFPLAIAVLHQVEQGRLTLQQLVHVPAGRLDTATWSPLAREHGVNAFDITLQDLLRYSVSKSDNNACDLLFTAAGGCAAVQQYLRSKGIRDIGIVYTEAEMKQAWSRQYKNSCKPVAMLDLLRLCYSGQLLSRGHTRLLLQLMTESENAPNRIKGLLPATAIVAHKTGTSGANAAGVQAAVNDIGVITLPDGRHYALVVYVSDFRSNVAYGERVIAQVSKLVWDTLARSVTK